MKNDKKTSQSPQQPEVVFVDLKDNKTDKKKAKKAWKIAGATAISLAVPSSLLAFAESSQSSDKSSKVVTLDTVPDTTTDPSTTGTDPSTTSTLVVDSTLPDTTLPDSTVDTTLFETTTTNPIDSGTTTPETTSPPLEGVLLNMHDNATNGEVLGGDKVTFTISIVNLDSIEKDMRVTLGFVHNPSTQYVYGYSVNCNSGWYQGLEGGEPSIDSLTLPPGQTCSISYSISTSDEDSVVKAISLVYDYTGGTVKTLRSRTIKVVGSSTDNSSTTVLPVSDTQAP